MSRPAGDGPLHASGVRVPIARPTHARLRAFSVELSRVKGRRVTISESIDELLDMLDREARMVQDIANGRRD